MQIQKLINKKEQILYCEGTINYTWIYYIDNSKEFHSKTLKKLETDLVPRTFIRIHKKYLVNKLFISSFSKVDLEIRLKNGIKLPVARRRHRILQSSAI
jgi:two-component system LytT family response regulator